MLPGYVYTPKSLQDHIHLGVVPVDGSSPTGFGAHGEPPYLVGHVLTRTPVYRAQSEYMESWDGTPEAVVLRDSLKRPIVKRDMKYQVRVNPEVFDLLSAILKYRVYLVDNWHCNDNISHSSFVKVMFFDDMAYNNPLDQNLLHQIVDLTFLDMYTIAPAT